MILTSSQIEIYNKRVDEINRLIDDCIDENVKVGLMKELEEISEIVASSIIQIKIKNSGLSLVH